MTLLMLLEMIASAFGDRLGIGSRRAGMTYARLAERAGAGAEVLRDRGAQHLAYVGPNDDVLPVALFASSWAGIPFVPLNYRLGEESLRALLAGHDDTMVVAAQEALPFLENSARWAVSLAEWNELTGDPVDTAPSTAEGDDVAVLLYTSGTTSDPKAVVLRHRHLTSYVVASVDFGGAEDTEATLVSVPPYHVAGVASVLSNVYSGRRIVYLPAFTPESWLGAVRSERVTHAMVVPTMLSRLVDHLGGGADAAAPSLRSIAYGGARMPVRVLESALRTFKGTGFVNAYGLTETSSTIAVLGPDDHRAAANGDEAALARLGSAGRVVPGVEVDVRDGEIWVRGEQVSGEYLGQDAPIDEAGWFPTRDRGWLDDDGYLFIEGRSDDTIIRGGENVAPAEVEDVLLAHPSVRDVAVVGVPDDEWGQRIAAAVVLRNDAVAEAGELREWARATLRSSKTPDLIVFREELPHTETGKLLRRLVLDDLMAEL